METNSKLIKNKKPHLEFCPFCGYEAKFIPYLQRVGGWAFCPNLKCILGEKLFDYKQWNTRTTPIKEEIEIL